MALLSFVGSPHGGKHKLLPEWQSQARITPTTIIDHSIVGSALGAFYYFRDSTGTESHFIVDLNGEIWQLMDTGRKADANLGANGFAISIETADRGNPNVEPWTPQQIASLKWLHRKLAAVHPTIPRRRIPSCSGGGLGYHSQCGTTSSKPWTSAAGKTCPGKPARVAQWETILLPDFVRSSQPAPEEEHPLALSETERKALANDIATALTPVLDRFITANHIFVGNTEHPEWGVMVVIPPGQLVHIPDPGRFGLIAGEGLGEGLVLNLPGHAPIWQLPRNDERETAPSTTCPLP